MLKQYQKTKKREAVAGAMKVRGYMLKKSKSLLSNYQRRFFMILDDYLAYFTDETLDELRKQISLSDIKEIRYISDVQFSFFYKIKLYIFKTESTKERDQWVSSLTILTEYLESVRREPRPADNSHEPLLTRKLSQQTEFECNLRTTFRLLHLSALAEQYHEDYIKCRVAGHLCSRGCIFLVSCKSLLKQIKDQIILDKEYIDPYDFNVLYLFNVDTRACTKLIASEDIIEVVLTARTLRVNTITINLINEQTQFTSDFIDRLRASISIGNEYRNTDGIALRQNVDYLVELFGKTEDRLQKQHLQMKLEDEYIATVVHFSKDYKRNYDKFQSLIKYLTTQIQDTLNAIKLKKDNLEQLSVMYVTFYYQKIYKLLKNFWSDNYETLKIEELVSMTALAHNYYNTISKYVEDGSKFVSGIKLLRDIYLKKILAEIEVSLKELMRAEENFTLKSDKMTHFSLKFMGILKQKSEVIEKHCNSQELIKESQHLLLEAAILLLINQLDTRVMLHNNQESLLIAFCNDIWSYNDSLTESYPQVDLSEVSKSLSKFHRSLVKKMYNHFYSERTVQFLNISIEYYVRRVTSAISKLQNIHQKSLADIKERMAEDFNTLYFRNLVSACQKSIIFKNVINQMIQKVQRDLTIVSKFFPAQSGSKVTSLFKCLILLLTEEQEDKIKQCYIDLKFNISPEDFRQNDIKSLLQLKYSSEESERKISFLDCMEQPYQNTSESLQIEPAKSQASTRPRRETQPRTQAQLLINNDIDLEGYLQMKKIGMNYSSGNYVQEYFRVNSECLLWYTNPNSQDLIGRIFLTDIKEVYLHTRKPQKFYIDLKNQVRHKFKACSPDIAIKWVQQINCSSMQPKTVKSTSIRNFQIQDIFVNFFEEFIVKKNGQQRPSMLSNYRNHEPSRLNFLDMDDSSLSPIKSKKEAPAKKKFNLGKLFGCVSLQ